MKIEWTNRTVVDHIIRARMLLNKNIDDLSEAESEYVNQMLIRIAKFQPSPSKLNALAILKHPTTTPESIAESIVNWEKL